MKYKRLISLCGGLVALVMMTSTAMAAQYAYVINGLSNISTFNIDYISGKLSYIGSLTAANGSSKITINSRHTFAYSLTSPTISTYAIDQSTGALNSSGEPTLIPSAGYYGYNLNLLAIDPNGKFMYVAKGESSSYGGSITIDTFAIDQTTGTPSFVSSTYLVNYPGSVGGFSLDPTGTYLYLTHPTYGLIFVLAIDQLTGSLAVVQQAGDPANNSSYPYKITIHPSGKFAYATHQYQTMGDAIGQISIYTVDAITGKLTPLRGKQVGKSLSAIAIEPTGNFAYVTDGIENNIKIFRIDQTTGDIASVGASVVTGISPSHIYIDKFGRFAYVTNSGSNNIYVFGLNATTGSMTLIQSFNTSLSSSSMMTGFFDESTPPFLILNAPDDGIYTSAAALTISGTAIGFKSLTVNGVTVALNQINGSFSTALTLKSGANTITIVTIDRDGNQKTETRTINLDTTPPAITLSTSANNSITNNATLNIFGKVSDNGGVKDLTINGNAVTFDPEGKFDTSITLVAGNNTITVIATDNASNQKRESQTITLDQTAPIISLTAPGDNIAVNSTTVNINGSVSENATVAITVNNVAVQTLNQNSNNFSATVNLTLGSNTIQITATDLAGNTTTVKRSVTSDTTAPSLTIMNPNQDVTTYFSNITITGTVSDQVTDVRLTLTCDGQTYTPTVAADGSFSQVLTFSTAKTYAAILTVADSAGNIKSVQRNIIYAPVILGDVNNDATINVFDALLTLQYAVGLYHPTGENVFKYTADVAPLDAKGKPLGDSTVNVFDALAILRHAVNLDDWTGIPKPPTVPTNLKATPSDTSITYSWDTVSGATGYNLYYRTTSGVTKANGIKLAGVTSPKTISGLSSGTTYYAVVTGVNANGESIESYQVSATTLAPVLTDFSGIWSGSFNGTTFSYEITQSGNNISMIRYSPPPTSTAQGIAYSGTISGSSAVVNTYVNGTYMAAATWTKRNDTTMTAVIDSCNPVPGYSCGAPGTVLTVYKQK